MLSAPPTKDESNRIEALYRYNILDTDFEEQFDDIVKVASILCDAPIALISLVDPERQWFKATCGVDARETSRDVAFCSHAIHGKDVFIVPDALEDERFHDNPLVAGDPKIRFYAGAPLITNDGYAIGTICTIDRKPRQLTEKQIEGLQALSRQVCLNLELRLQTKILSEVNESKNKLFSIISHDLRSPLFTLNSVIDHLDTDLESMPKDELRMWHDTIRKSAKTSLSVAENLLKWARFEDGSFHYDPTDIDLPTLFSNVCPMLEECAKTKEISIEFSTNKQINVRADQTMLHSVLQNIVSNAIKFTPNNGTISISTESDSDHAHITVKDSGLGMTPKTLENLFKIEATYSKEGTNGEKGSGLGLSLCKQFTEKMDGSILVESNEKNGTTVKVSLPLSPSKKPNSTESPLSSPVESL